MQTVTPSSSPTAAGPPGTETAPASDEGPSPLFRAQRSLEAIGQLAAGIVHEVNTPAQFVADNLYFLQRTTPVLLSALRSAATLVDAVKQTDTHPELVARVESEMSRIRLDYITGEIPKALAQSQEGLSRIASIVHSMKLFSRPDRGEPEPIDFAEAIQACITLCRNEWKLVAEVEMDLAEELPSISVHREQLQQVLLNLVINACHAIKARQASDPSFERGHIRVSVAPAEDGVDLEIADDGCGIPEEARDRVFHPFFTTKPPGVGTGQGLAIAWTVVVERHGGHLDFESEVGTGTTFRIHLPSTPRPEETRS